MFFQDVTGSPPSASNTSCGAHHKAYADLAGDLSVGRVSGFVFIMSNLCHDMHGDSACPSGTAIPANIAAGDTWLQTELPRIASYARAHDAVIFLTWDEGDSSNVIPFLAIGNHVKPGPSATTYSHSSMLKSIEEIFHMFQPGTFP